MGHKSKLQRGEPCQAPAPAQEGRGFQADGGARSVNLADTRSLNFELRRLAPGL